MSKKEKLVGLQAIRAIAFTGVVASHCGFNDGLGACGVSLFFVMSGFLMVYNYLDSSQCTQISIINNGKFAIKKISRLYSLHVLMMLFAIIPIIISWLRGLTELKWDFFAKIVLNLTLFQSWIPNNEWYCSLNAVAWFLSTCIFLYFIFPYVLNIVRKYKNKNNANIISAIIILIQIIVAVIANKMLVNDVSDNIARWITYICPLYRLGDFVIGCNLGYLFLNRNKIGSEIKYTIFEIVYVFILVLANYIYAKGMWIGGNQSIRYSLLFLFPTMGIVYVFACGKGIVSKILMNKVTIYIGNISGYAFLIHLMVIEYLNVFTYHFFNIDLSQIIKTAVVFIITIVSTEIYLQLNKCVMKRYGEKRNG